MHHYGQLSFYFLVEAGFHHIDQAGFELLASGNPPASASQIAGITGMRHLARPTPCLRKEIVLKMKIDTRRLNQSNGKVVAECYVEWLSKVDQNPSAPST